MKRTALGTLITVLAAACVGWSVGGSVGRGLACGAGLGAAISLGGLAWQGYVFRTQPASALSINMVVFLFTLFLVLGMAIALRKVGALASLDGRSFLLAFGGFAAIVPPIGLAEITHSRSRSTALARAAEGADGANA
jgi:hypothetical protein